MTSVNILDEDLKSHGQDFFNRWPFCERLATTLVSLANQNGAPVVGLFGKWGYGKTTALNFVTEALKSKPEITTLRFNPWLFKDPESLLISFFAALAAEVDRTVTDRGKLLGDFLARYAGALSAVPVIGTGLANTAIALGKDLAANPIEAQRARIIEFMRDSKRKVIVIIDDLDRLDKAEIMTVLKLVRLVANFPNVVYLLAFDEERVARVAGEAYGEANDGRQFLEKIIQIPVSLPAVSKERLLEFVLQHARAACEAACIALAPDIWQNFSGVFRDSLLVRLNTPRQAIRYANALRFALPMLADEVDPYKQMLVEAMRVLFPELYAWARANPRLEQRDIYKVVAQAMGNANNEDRGAAENLLLKLTAFEAARFKPVFNDFRYHGRYFSYAVEPNDISDKELQDLLLLAKAGPNDTLTSEIHRLFTLFPHTLLERLDQSRADLTRTSTRAFIHALGSSSDSSIVSLDGERLRNHMTEVMLKLISHRDQQDLDK